MPEIRSRGLSGLFAPEMVVGVSQELPGVVPPAPVPASNPSPAPTRHSPALLLFPTPENGEVRLQLTVS